MFEYDPDEGKIEVFYLTYSFYAPWVHSGPINTKRSYAHKQRKTAKEFGKLYRQKYRSKVELSDPIPSPPAPPQPKPGRRTSVKDVAAQTAVMNTFMQGLILHKT